MNIYNKLPCELQYIITNHIRKDIFIRNIKKLKEYRIKLIINNIYSITDYLNEEYLGDKIFFWFNENYPNISKKYISFLDKILPGISKNLSLSSDYIVHIPQPLLIRRGNVYFYYKKKHIGYYKDFIQMILDNLCITDLEELFNFIENNNYNTSINTSYIQKIY